jgi:hypothetical protein
MSSCPTRSRRLIEFTRAAQAGIEGVGVVVGVPVGSDVGGKDDELLAAGSTADDTEPLDAGGPSSAPGDAHDAISATAVQTRSR